MWRASQASVRDVGARRLPHAVRVMGGASGSLRTGDLRQKGARKARRRRELLADVAARERALARQGDDTPRCSARTHEKQRERDDAGTARHPEVGRDVER